MSFKDCILGKVTEGKLKDTQAKKLLKQYDERVAQLEASGRTKEEAEAFAQDLLNKESAKIQQRQRALMMHARKSQEIIDRLRQAQKNEPTNQFISRELQNAAARQETVKAQLYAVFGDEINKLKVNFAGLGRDYRTVSNAVLIRLGADIDDPNAAALAQAIGNFRETAIKMYREAGGVIGKIDNYAVSQVHAKEAISKVPYEQWSRDLLTHLDRQRMIDERTGLPFTDEALDEIMRDVYADVTTSGKYSKQRALEMGGDEPSFGGFGDINTRRDRARFFEFKSPESFLEYNRKYGVGDEGLPMLLLNDIEGFSRDIAIMQYLGPRPNELMKQLDKFMDADARVKPNSRRAVHAEYRVLTSQFQMGNIDSTWWKGLTATQNILRASLLANGILNTIPDTTISIVKSRMNGLDPIRALKFYGQFLAPGSSQLKKMAERAGHVQAYISGNAIGDTRFTGEAMGNGLPRHLANLMNVMNGQRRQTHSIMEAGRFEVAATFGDLIADQVPYDKLDDALRDAMTRHRITKADYDDLLKAGVYEGNTKFLVTTDMRADPEFKAKMRERFVGEAGESDELLNQLADNHVRELANKVDDFANNIAREFATEPSLAVKAWTTGAIFGDSVGKSGAGGPGTWERAVGSTIGLFKAFPITFIQSHLLPTLRQIERNNPSTMVNAGLLVIGGTIGGAAVIQLKNLAYGKTTQDMDTAKFWGRALAQGGGLGIFGDFLGADYSRYGQGFFSTLSGPVGGTGDDLIRATKGNFDRYMDDRDTNVTRDLMRIGLRNTPLIHVWYARLMMDRLVLDQLERLADPNYDNRIRKYERKLKKENGQKFWWRPGKTSPQFN